MSDTEEKPNTEEMIALNTNFGKLDPKTAVPKWHSSTDPKINLELVERFISLYFIALGKNINFLYLKKRVEHFCQRLK